MYKPIILSKNIQRRCNFWNCKSHKIGRDVYFYSELEYENWINVETDPKVVDFCEKPKKVRGVFEGRVYESTFDMWIKWKDGQEEFIEIVYDKTLKTSQLKQRKIKIQENWCNENNFRHRILTEYNIRIHPKLQNLKIILPYIKDFNNLNEIDLYKVKGIIKDEQQTLKEIIGKIDSIDRFSFFKSIFFLYYSGLIDMDIDDTPISFNSKVWLKIE
ncbi:TnsA endonuclease N-terminal domain-containing protein [Bacillus sp. JJ1773]|uniref:TnsA endonuclease N-terminal domain-containing protein n=1 Tax=Bacillus sp. JJ1773 TaxID=3122965 RepID=UPI002FFF0920